MADVITFRGLTLYSSLAGGVEWQFTHGGGLMEEHELVPAPLGRGYFEREGNMAVPVHTLRLAWVVGDVAALRASVVGVLRGGRGTLVVPGEGNLTNCRGLMPEWGERQRLDLGELVRATITFEQVS